jgi:hypothetical protein
MARSVSFETVPTQPATVLREEELVPRLDIERDSARGLLDRPLQPEDLGTDRAVVTIGQPEVLRALSSMEIPGFARVEPQDFYLLRLWCSFHDFDTDLRFERAHFRVSLSSPDDGRGIVARDMHPSEVMHRVKRDVNVTLSPEVTFQEVSANLGSFSYGFTYTELQPVILAAGQGETEPSWTFSRSKAQALQGGKAVHLLVAAPAGTSSADAQIELVAQVTKPGMIPLPMGIGAKKGNVPAEPVKARLW